MSFVLAADAIFHNINLIPHGLVRVGYTTGTPDIRWPSNVFNPADIRMCQDNGSDLTADELDIEPRAATNDDAAKWWPLAKHAYDQAKRPGQRFPALYTFPSNVTPLVNTLIKAGITSGPVLHIAKPNDPLTVAEAILANAGGPFPVIAIQYEFDPAFDLDVYSSDWYMRVSKMTPLPKTLKSATLGFSDGSSETFAV